MTRDQLLEECFGRSDFPPPNRTVELVEGRDVLAHLDIYLRRIYVRYAGDHVVEGQPVDASTTMTVATLENLCVDPSHRGKGFAAAMVRRAISELRENQPIRFVAVRVDPDDDPGPSFWHRLGFVEPPSPAGLVVFRLQEETWPLGRARYVGTWPR